MGNPRLDEWFILVPDEYTAPERRLSRLCGKVQDHPHQANGKVITTSIILSISIKKKLARTYSRIYELGSMSTEWEQWMLEKNYTIEDFIIPIVYNRSAAVEDEFQDQ